jgi:hypothetical protein
MGRFVFAEGGAEALFLMSRVLPGGSRHSSGHRGPGYAGIPITYPAGGDMVTLSAVRRTTARRRRRSTGRAPRVWKRTLVCYAGPQPLKMLTALLAHGDP